MHVRKPHKRKSSISFRYRSPIRRNLILNYTSTYKYLRVVLDEHKKKKKNADCSSRVLGSLLARFYINNGMGFKTFKMSRRLHHQSVDYSAGVWGLGSDPNIEKVQPIARIFPRSSQVLLFMGKWGFTPSEIRRKVEILRKIFEVEYIGN